MLPPRRDRGTKFAASRIANSRFAFGTDTERPLEPPGNGRNAARRATIKEGLFGTEAAFPVGADRTQCGMQANSARDPVCPGCHQRQPRLDHFKRRVRRATKLGTIEREEWASRCPQCGHETIYTPTPAEIHFAMQMIRPAALDDEAERIYRRQHGNR